MLVPERRAIGWPEQRPNEATREREKKKAKHRGKSPGKCLKGHCSREGMR